MKQNSPPQEDSVTVQVEITPGRTVGMSIPRSKVGRYGLTKIMVQEDGTPLVVWKSWHTHVRLTRDLPSRLGLPVDIDSLRTLILAGIVKGTKFTPGTTLVCMDSLVAHLEAATGEGARAYWRGAREQAYNEAWTHRHAQGMTHRVRKALEKQGKTKKPQPKAKTPAAAPAPRPVRPAPAADPRQMDLFNP